jgi:hypothetical protein
VISSLHIYNESKFSLQRSSLFVSLSKTDFLFFPFLPSRQKSKEDVISSGRAGATISKSLPKAPQQKGANLNSKIFPSFIEF